MAWSTPETYTTGLLMTATKMNLISANLNALKAPPGDDVELTGDISTTSTSFVDLTGATVTFTSAGGNLFAMFTATVTGASAAVITFRFALDGTGTNNTLAVAAGDANPRCATFFWRWTSGISAGSHTIKVQWKVSTGTGTVSGATSASAFLYAGELPT